jgi:tetratricopeptide (TPR) repeat protein
LRKQARADFEESAKFIPQSPDPHLALARVYVYSAPNLERALAELQRAQKLGAKLGPREIEEQADAYRIRAQQIQSSAPREAWQAAQMARTLYRKLGKFDRSQAHLQELASIRQTTAKERRRIGAHDGGNSKLGRVRHASVRD